MTSGWIGLPASGYMPNYPPSQRLSSSGILGFRSRHGCGAAEDLHLSSLASSKYEVTLWELILSIRKVDSSKLFKKFTVNFNPYLTLVFLSRGNYASTAKDCNEMALGTCCDLAMILPLSSEISHSVAKQSNSPHFFMKNPMNELPKLSLIASHLQKNKNRTCNSGLLHFPYF